MFRSHRIKILITLAGVILVCAVLVSFTIIPLLSRIVSLNEEIKNNQLDLVKITTEIKNFEKATRDLEKYKLGRGALTAMFPVREEMVSLVQGLESVINRAGLSAELKIADKKEELMAGSGGREVISTPTVVPGLEPIEEIPYLLEARGDYRSLINFFVYLESLPFVSEITKINITADSIQEEARRIIINTGTGIAKIEGVFFIRAGEIKP